MERLMEATRNLHNEKQECYVLDHNVPSSNDDM
jgi:hypothetical protein